MGVGDVIYSTALFLSVASICAYYLIELRPESILARKLVEIFTAKPKNISSFNPRSVINVDELALIENSIPKLHSVIVLCNVVEAPTKRLLDAVFKNLRQGTQYKFFVSKNANTNSDLASYFEWFHAIYTAARQVVEPGEKAEIGNLDFETLFSIKKLAFDWSNVPYVFYVYKNGGSKLSTFALKGAQRGVGVSDTYFRVDPIEAESILALCEHGAADFRVSFGAETPTFETNLPQAKIASRTLSDNNVIPINDRRSAS